MLTPLFFAVALFPQAAPLEAPPAAPSVPAATPSDARLSSGQGKAQETPIKNAGALEAGTRACEWLISQQNADGSWSPSGVEASSKPEKEAASSEDDDEFWKRALEGEPRKEASAPSLEPGDPLHAVGVTGLAILALTEGGSSAVRGPHKKEVLKAAHYLLSQQDAETGLIGEPVGHAFHYDHAIASFALARLQRLGGPAVFQPKLQLALNYIARARNPYSVWRYDNPPNGENDSSMSTWMILAVEEAEESGIKVDGKSFPDAIAWFDKMTEPGTGRVGYTERGSPSSRVPGKNEAFGTKPETLTAAGLVSRLACGQTPRKNPVLVNHVRCILQALPEDDEPRLTDALWFYYGTAALREIDSRPWEKWSTVMIPLAMAAQKKEGPIAGSFDPQSVAWGFSTGRVGTTALNAAALHIAAR